MMKLGLGVGHLGFLVDYFTLIPLKVCFWFSNSTLCKSFHADSSLKIHFTLEILMSLKTSILAAKLLWQGEECWKECLKLLSVAEAAAGYKECNWEVQESERNRSGFIVRRRLGWRSFLFIPPQMLTGVKTFSYMTLFLCLDASFEISKI